MAKWQKQDDHGKSKLNKAKGNCEMAKANWFRRKKNSRRAKSVLSFLSIQIRRPEYKKSTTFPGG